MTVKYITIKDTKNGSDGDACAFNSAILAEGVQGVTCVEAGQTFIGENTDYRDYIPAGHYFSTTERYLNGAKNLFVRNQENKVVGYLIVRP